MIQLKKLKIHFKGKPSFIYFCPFYGDEEEKCIKTLIGEEGEAVISFEEEVSYLRETIRPFFPRQVMFGCTCHGKEAPERSFPTKMELGIGLFKIFSLTIIADEIHTALIH